MLQCIFRVFSYISLEQPTSDTSNEINKHWWFFALLCMVSLLTNELSIKGYVKRTCTNCRTHLKKNISQKIGNIFLKMEFHIFVNEFRWIKNIFILWNFKKKFFYSLFFGKNNYTEIQIYEKNIFRKIENILLKIEFHIFLNGFRWIKNIFVIWNFNKNFFFIENINFYFYQ